MTAILELGRTIFACPRAWVNFFKDELDAGPSDSKGDISIEYINEKLQQYNAHWGDDDQSLVFADESSKLLFLIKWS